MGAWLVGAYQIRKASSVSIHWLKNISTIRLHAIGELQKWIFSFGNAHFRAKLDILLPMNNKDTSNVEIELKPSTDVYYAASRFLSLFKENSPAYSQRLEHLCRYLLASLESENPKLSYIGVALNKDLSIAWIRHIKLLLYKCCICMEKLKPGKLSIKYGVHALVFYCSDLLTYFYKNFRHTFRELDTRSVFSYASFIYIAKYLGTVESKNIDGPEIWNVTALQQCARCFGSKRIFHYTTGKKRVHSRFSTKTSITFVFVCFLSLQQILLKGTSRTAITLKPISFKAVLSLSIRPLISGNFSENLMSMFLVHILSTPALIYQIESNISETLQLFQTNAILERSLELLEKEQNLKIITNSMKGTQSLALLANLIHLFHLEPIETATKFGFPTFTVKHFSKHMLSVTVTGNQSCVH